MLRHRLFIFIAVVLVVAAVACRNSNEKVRQRCGRDNRHIDHFHERDRHFRGNDHEYRRFTCDYRFYRQDRQQPVRRRQTLRYEGRSELASKKGKDFEKACMKDMVSDHEKDVKKFEKESKEAKNADSGWLSVVDAARCTMHRRDNGQPITGNYASASLPPSSVAGAVSPGALNLALM
ncbi:MAG TPA: DUF4142 domain-containing protein [Thermoanaerobaculia bacterium]